MNDSSLKLVYLTAGAAGMFCGSCMHDNTLVKAMRKLGYDAQLLPLYTPIRTDETSVAASEIFYGGVNVYLQQQWPLFRYLPRWLDRWLDQPWLLRWATARGMQTQAKLLGELTVSILRGEQGHQRKEVHRLADWLAQHEQPDVLLFTNMLVAGGVPVLKRRLGSKILITLQGDDIFLNDLPSPYRDQALAEMRRLVNAVDGFLLHSEYYANVMRELLHIPASKIHVVPLGIDVSDFVLNADSSATTHPPTIGYLARLAPEKGLHNLIDAFIYLHRELRQQDAHLALAGWLGKQHAAYAAEQFQKLQAAGLSSKFRYWGEVDRSGKLEFLKSIDLLSVPTDYHEPKGIFVREAWAMGLPVVQPAHGAFPEMLAASGGGQLVPPQDIPALARAWQALLTAPAQRLSLGNTARNYLLAQGTADHAAQAIMKLAGDMLGRNA